MRKLAFATAAAAFGVALATPALAQNGDFSGPRLEALAGYDNLQDGGDGDSEGREGFTYGALLGYDFQRGNIVYGIDGEITDATTKSRSYNEVTAGDRFSVEAGRDLYIGGRLGYVISPAAMIYAKGGYTNARVESRYQPNTGADNELVDKADLDGFRLGAGLEYKLTPTAFVKGEYRYSHYGEIEGYNIDLDRHQLMAGLGIRF
ncbi:MULTISPECIES: outer membrane protein [unclassified Sphingomonas]|uniref:outer membrane protein n=1 Tax=unclassified Sphingomonas TaxID=196159 RepID=UPI00161BB26A|nr:MULTISPECIES: porin family protein [unclassified Sphingomonas]MBB3348925.1 outer membrane immunogenic protein [Sphingomonas sp. BK069]MBB3472702.1 outer membrane immunogenic protein [Sphingomonas sp. BK345]